ncbi:bone morphogenetic protein 2-A [Frieseomelitta varia]|nr:bone morphogenetic protein 2-A [Frieseomelitta varia]
MGKLATIGRLVTRDNEEQEASVWLLERNGASSGRALVAVPIGGIAVCSVIVPQVGSKAPTGVAGRNTFTGTAPSCFENNAGKRREDRRRIVGIQEATDDDLDFRYVVETANGGDNGEAGRGSTVVRLESSSFGSSPSSRESKWWLDDVVRDNGRTDNIVREYCSRISNEWCRVSRKKSLDRRTIVEGKRCERCRRRWHRRRWLTGNNESSRLFGITTTIVAIVVAVAAVALCVPAASAVPMLPRENPLSRTGPRHDLDRSTGLEDVYEDAFREEDRPTTGTVLDETELDIIRRSIARGLGLKRIPDPSKANVSQAEYERAHREYLMRLQSSLDEQTFGSKKMLHVFPATEYPGNESSLLAGTNGKEKSCRHWLFFPVEVPEKDLDQASVDHATLRLLLHGPTTDHYTERSELEVLFYLRISSFRRSRKLIGRRKIQLHDSRNPRWLELDATQAAFSWIETPLENLGVELEFMVDSEPVPRTFSSPVLNVFTTTYSGNGRMKRSSPKDVMSLHKGRRTKCKGESKKCCRHELTVMFKDLKGFEFIVYPKTFDAGYCKGRCPPRYNPAHHHALLQSLLWKEDRKKVPKPCCAPSKLDELMIVYFDENDTTQLKNSYWKNIQVLECACS